MKTHYQQQELVHSNPRGFPYKLYDAYSGNKRQQSHVRAVEDSKMASAERIKTALFLFVADDRSQILFEVSNVELVSLARSFSEWPSTTKKL